LARLLLSLALRDRAFCALRRRRSALRRNFGEAIFFPLERTAKWVRPRSIPTSPVVSGSGSPGTSTTNEAKYRPAESLTTVTDDGSAGSSRDQRTRISPTLATYSRPFGRMAKPLRVSRIACRLSLRDRKSVV